MKILLLSIACLASCQTDPMDLVTDKKWYVAYTRDGDKLLPMGKIAERPWARFGKDHSFTNNISGKTETGTWSFDEKNKELTTTEKEHEGLQSVLKVLKMTADTLELFESKSGSTVGLVSK